MSDEDPEDADGPVEDADREADEEPEESEDWFERAMQEMGGEEPEAGEPAAGESAETPEREEGPEPGEEDAEPSGREFPEVGGEAPEEGGTSPRSAGRQTEEGPFGGGEDLGGGGGEGAGFGGSSEEFGGDEDLGGEGADFGGGGEEFGGGGGEDFGFGDFGGGGGGGGEDFGFGGEGGGTDFDEEEFESEIDRIDVGIEGLDEMILGGVPQRSLMVSIGSAGTGKTTFGLQFLHEALRNDGKGVYITLEESREDILSTAEEKGWPFRDYEEAGQLAVVALDPIEMANSLASIRNDISRLIGEFGADRLVLDSVSLLEMMYDTPAKRRSEVFDFARSLKNAGVTTMLTSEASEDNPYTSRYGIVEYLVDAVFILQYVRPSDFRETRLAVEIQKIRDANHSRETKPYEITSEGISVYRQANIF